MSEKMTVEMIRAAYQEVKPLEVFPPLPRWEAFDRAVVGVLLDEIDRLTRLNADTFRAGSKCRAGREYDPHTREDITDRKEPCCECGEDYPRADLALRGEIYCAKCRETEKARKPR